MVAALVQSIVVPSSLYPKRGSNSDGVQDGVEW